MKKSYFYVIAAAVFWGIIGIFVRELTALGLNQMQVVLLRVTVATVSLIPVLCVLDIRLFKIRLKDIWCFIGTGIISLTFFNYCTFTAMRYTSLSVSAILLYTSPVFVMLMSAALFKEKITLSRLGALALIFLGCSMVTGIWSGGEMTVTPAGILYGLGSGFGYALYSIFARFATNKGYHPITVTFYTFLFSVISCLPLANTGALLSQLSLPILLYALGLGTLCSVVPFVLYTKGMVLMETGTAAMLASLEPVVASIAGALFFHEAFTVYHIGGLLLLLGGIYLLSIKKSGGHK